MGLNNSGLTITIVISKDIKDVGLTQWIMDSWDLLWDCLNSPIRILSDKLFQNYGHDFTNKEDCTNAWIGISPAQLGSITTSTLRMGIWSKMNGKCIKNCWGKWASNPNSSWLVVSHFTKDIVAFKCWALWSFLSVGKGGCRVSPSLSITCQTYLSWDLKCRRLSQTLQLWAFRESQFISVHTVH